MIRLPAGLFAAALAVSSIAQTPGIPPEPVVSGDVSMLPILGEQSYLVLRIKYAGSPNLPMDHETAVGRAQLTAQSLTANSYGRMTPSFTIVPQLLVLSGDLTSYQNLVRLRHDAVAAAAAVGYDATGFDREILLVPQIGTSGISQGIGYRTLVIRGTAGPYTWVHELGHTYGFSHANAWQPVASPNDPADPGGKNVEYGDNFDPMGNSAAAHHYNPWFKYRASWLTDSEINTVTSSDVYTIQGLPHTPGGHPSALRVPRAAGTDYWVCLRDDETFPQPGISLTWGFRTNVQPSYLLDMPPVSGFDDPVLHVGESFTDVHSGISFSLLSLNSVADPPTAAVSVTVPGTTYDQLPVVDVRRPQPGKIVSGQVTYRARAADPDSGQLVTSVTLSVRLLTDKIEGLLRSGGPLPATQDTQFGTITMPTVTLTGTQSVYELTVDTTTYAGTGLPSALYVLVVDATSSNGATNRVSLQHLIDNL